MARAFVCNSPRPPLKSPKLQSIFLLARPSLYFFLSSRSNPLGAKITPLKKSPKFPPIEIHNPNRISDGQNRRSRWLSDGITLQRCSGTRNLRISVALQRLSLSQIETALRLLAGEDEELSRLIPVLLGCRIDNVSDGNFIEVAPVKKILRLGEDNAYSYLMEIIGSYPEEQQKMFGRHFEIEDELVCKLSRNSVVTHNYAESLGVEETRLPSKLKKLFKIQ